MWPPDRSLTTQRERVQSLGADLAEQFAAWLDAGGNWHEDLARQFEDGRREYRCECKRLAEMERRALAIAAEAV